MPEVTNTDRADWATLAIRIHSKLAEIEAEPKSDQARDLVGNIWHFLRLECGMTAEGATAQIEMALAMAREEYRDDKD
jgi:hypothetical protein